MKKKETQLRSKVKEIVAVLESVADESESKANPLSDTYSELSPEDREKLLEGLKEILNDPTSIEKNQDVIPIHLVMIDPRMREIQMLINEIVAE